jgi:hypothetical protein
MYFLQESNCSLPVRRASESPPKKAHPSRPTKSPMKPSSESATEIVKVSSKDRKLFEEDYDYSYYNYYEERRYL